MPSTIVPVFVCPSAASDPKIVNTKFNKALKLLVPETQYPDTQEFAVTHYIFCKGSTDAWCRAPIPKKAADPPFPSERGMFDIRMQTPMRKITDGTSNTIAMGEGASGPKWPLGSRNAPIPPVDELGFQRLAYHIWISAEPGWYELSAVGGLYFAGNLGCTLEPINKSPVTHAWAQTNSSGLDNCRKGIIGAPGTKTPTSCTAPSNCGPHETPGFRSDHSGGCNFLFADGSVHYLNEDINMLTYQQLSTMAGGDIVEIPE